MVHQCTISFKMKRFQLISSFPTQPHPICPGLYIPLKCGHLHTPLLHATLGHAPFPVPPAAPSADCEDFDTVLPHTPLFLPPATSWDLSALLGSCATWGFPTQEQGALAEFSCNGYYINDPKLVLLLHILVLHLRLSPGMHSRHAHFIEFIPIRYLPIGKNVTALTALSASEWHLDDQQQLRSLNAFRGVLAGAGEKAEGGATGSREKTSSWCDLVSGILHCSLC